MLGSAQCGFHKKRAGTRYAELVFLHLVRYAGYIDEDILGACGVWFDPEAHIPLVEYG
jgi:hypothetical protein